MEKGYRKQNGMNFIKWMFRIFVCIVIGYFLLGEILLPPDSPSNDYSAEEFLSSWVQVMPDGSRIHVDIPGKCESERGEVVTIETTLPDKIDRDQYMCFRSSKQDMNFYIDGKLRTAYSTKDTRIFGKTTAVAYVFVEILSEDAGKTLRVETQTDSAYSGIIYSIYYGDRMGIWYNFFEQHGAELLIALLAFILGAMSIVGSMFLKLVYHRQMDLEYLGWSVAVCSVWIIANSVFRQVLFPNISTINDMTFYMVMLMPFPFLIYLNEVQRNRYVKVYFCVGVIAVLDFVICTALHVMRIVDFADTIKYMAVTCLFTVLTLVLTIVADIRRKYIWQYRLVALGMFGACLAAVIQFANYFARSKEFECSVLAMGLIFLLGISIINTGQGILHMESEKQQAILQSAAKARFLANMSHEIRTPINAIIGMDEVILRESSDAQIKEYALDIHNASQGLLSLINEILDLSKIESGKMEIIPVDYDFSSVIHDVVNMVRGKAKDKGLAVNVEVDHELPARYYGDEVRIRQILLNLLNNAVKYTEQGSISLLITGEVHEDAALLRFSVNDTGIGIKEEDISKLFEEYERIEEQRNRNIEGTGLGMNITMTLLRMMGSELQVSSEYGKGSSFSFVLSQPITDSTPIGNLDDRIRNQAEEYTYNVSFTAPHAHILVVDDNSVNRKVFRSLLKLTMVNIDEASSGQECLDMVMERHYDIIFLDHMMPDMDGIETLHRMKKMKNNPCSGTPVVALTANAISGAKEMYLGEGFNAFVSKPIVSERLEQLIRDLLPDELITDTDEYIGIDSKETAYGITRGDGKDDSSKMDGEEVLPEIAGIDWDYALVHIPNVDTLRETVEAFYDTIDYDGQSLSEYTSAIMRLNDINVKTGFSSDDGIGNTEVTINDIDDDSLEQILDKYRINIHKMKGSAAMIGAVQLYGTAQLLENCAKEGKSDIIIGLTPPFLEEWYSYKDKLKCMVPDKEGKLKPIDTDIVFTYLDVLKDAMEDMDIDVLDATMDELMEYKYPDDIDKDVKLLKMAVDNLDENEMIRLIELIRGGFYEENTINRQT